jgi:formyltetrahydrofolate deformylase
MKRTAVLIITCPDQRGIVAGVADFLYQHQANIVHADQHQDAAQALFFMRVEWDLDGFQLPLDQFAAAFAPLERRFELRWKLLDARERPRLALFVSKYDHCLADLLYRHRAGELRCDIPLILSNHEDARALAAFYSVPFHVVPVDNQRKLEAERQQIALLDRERISLVVLARYMQVLSPAFVSRYPNGIINVHHSFLPAFVGAKPYHQAFERGVKLIGATSHYVTDVLDDGPIIEQETARISHRDQLDDLLQKGRELERHVLSRAVRWHVEGRIVVYGKKTVIFD